MGDNLESNSSAIDSSNRGFQLLKKCGWTEGTGLGASEQGRLEPLQAHVKKNKRGLGAEKTKKTITQIPKQSASNGERDNEHSQSEKKTKTLSKRARKVKEQEERLQEQEFERAFFREFWPDNV